jgi:hypothetical protein
MLRGADNAPACSCQAARSFNANQLGLATVATCAYLCEQRFFQGQNLTAKPAVFSMSWLGLQSNNPLGNTIPP